MKIYCLFQVLLALGKYMVFLLLFINIRCSVSTFLITRRLITHHCSDDGFEDESCKKNFST